VWWWSGFVVGLSGGGNFGGVKEMVGFDGVLEFVVV